MSQALQLPPQFRPDNEFLDVVRLMDNTYNNLFLTGRAGTGKSTLLTYFRRYTKKNVAVLAPTGIAAMNVGGQTIHSFFGFPPRIMRPDDPEVRPWPDDSPRRKLVSQLDTLVIDEVSMVRPDMLDAISQCLQYQLGSTEPFGGVQVILIGDAYQLAPVERENDETEAQHDLYLGSRRTYKTTYFFSADAFKQGEFSIIELTRIHRQKDPVFVDLLNHIRLGTADATHAEALNERYDPWAGEDSTAILLATTNAIADRVNERHLNDLGGRTYQFPGETANSFPLSMVRADQTLTLKEGARIMMLNNDMERRWVNGSLGTITGFDEDPDTGKERIVVMFDNKQEHSINRFTWENAVFRLDQASADFKRQVLGTFTQFPMRLAWAVTIHKSQGLTFDRVRVDLGRGTFSPGQLYVALSRCRTLEGLILQRPIQLEDIKVSPAVAGFYQWCEKRIAQGVGQIYDRPRRPDKPAKVSAEERQRKRLQRQAVSDRERADRNLKEGKAAKDGARYTKEETETLISLFEEGFGLEHIARQLKRTASAVGSKLKSLERLVAFQLDRQFVVIRTGLYEPEQHTFREWTPEELDRLRTLWHAGTDGETIAVTLDRGLLAVILRLETLGELPKDVPSEFGPLRFEYRK